VSKTCKLNVDLKGNAGWRLRLQ